MQTQEVTVTTRVYAGFTAAQTHVGRIRDDLPRFAASQGWGVLVADAHAIPGEEDRAWGCLLAQVPMQRQHSTRSSVEAALEQWARMSHVALSDLMVGAGGISTASGL